MLQKIDKLVQFASYAGVIGITVLSLLPAEIRPHTGAGGYGEHAMAYLLTAFLFGLRRESVPQLFWIFLMFVLGASVLEMLQIWVPGRSSKFSDIVASSLGSAVGLAIGGLLAQFYRAWIPKHAP